MGSKLDAMKKAAKQGPPPKAPKPAPAAKPSEPAPNPPQKPHTRTPWKHRHQLRGRLPDGSQMHAVYNAKSETEGEWTVTLVIENKPGNPFAAPPYTTKSFTATRSALFAACVAADKMYRETLQVPTHEERHERG